MKTAIYIEDGTVQLVLTPESEFEKSALRSFEDKPHETRIFSGSFYDCRGGWVRQSAHIQSPLSGSGDSGDRSLILRSWVATGARALGAENSIRRAPVAPTPTDYGASIRGTDLVGRPEEFVAAFTTHGMNPRAEGT